jgi:D-amino peptidase
MGEAGLRVYISVDMEGITGVVDFPEIEEKGADYGVFRKIMVQEVNAAVEGALEAGAGEIVVRDAHDSARNLLPGDLHREARLLRNWADSPLCMMEGIDAGFDAAVFIGYHARAGTADAALPHTMTLKIFEVRMNGIPLSEAGLNALIAGEFGVPVVFLSGDKAICEQVAELWEGVTTVAVKEGRGKAVLSLHPEKSRELIRAGVAAALRDRGRVAPYRLAPPYEMEIVFTDPNRAFRMQFYPGAEYLPPRTVRFRSERLMDCLTFFYFC